MRATATVLATLLVLVSILPAAAAQADRPVVRQASLQQGQPPAQANPSGKSPEIDVHVGDDDAGGTVWYTNPLWITIGVIAALVVIVIIALAARGGGSTTVIREERRP